jgi:hypothetical protein
MMISRGSNLIMMRGMKLPVYLRIQQVEGEVEGSCEADPKDVRDQ